MMCFINCFETIRMRSTTGVIINVRKQKVNMKNGLHGENSSLGFLEAIHQDA